VDPSGLSVEGGDGGGVEVGGVESLRGHRLGGGGRAAIEEEALCRNHLSGQEARSRSRVRVAACSRSWEASTTAWMVAIASTNTDEASGGTDDVGPCGGGEGGES
jgi:hypothetical protein